MKLAICLFLLSIGLFAETAQSVNIPKETKLLMQIAELEMQLAQSQFENSKHVQKVLEANFKTAQAKHAELQLASCKSVGGKVKEDCDFTPDTVSLKKKPGESAKGEK